VRTCIRWGWLAVLASMLAACSGGGSSLPTCSYDDPPAPAVSSPWRKFHHDEQNTGAVTVTDAQLGTLTCRWVFPPGGSASCTTALSRPPKGAFAASPVISGDGMRLYIGSRDGTLYALNTADGMPSTSPSTSAPFSFSIAKPITSTAVVARRSAGEVLFVGALDGNLYGLTDTGDSQPVGWPNAIGGFVSASPSLLGDGTVCVGSLNGTFLGACPNGVARYILSTGSSQSSPAQGPDGTLYFGDNDSLLHAVQFDGTVSWSFSAAGPILAAPVFDTATNSVYVADQAGRVFKVIAGGRPDLAFAFPPATPTPPSPGSISSSPALAEDHLYFGSDDGNLYAIDKCTGAPAWSSPFTTGGAIVSSPAVAIITSEPLQPTTCSSSGSPAVHQRIVVVGSNDGNVYFVEDNGTGTEPVEFAPPFDITAFDCARCTGGPNAGAACHGTSDCPKSTCDTSSCAVQSSPAIGISSEGTVTVYVGASDGRVYAIGAPLPEPTPSPSPTPSS
jgi:outer membrane protein assembly factor BamB